MYITAMVLITLAVTVYLSYTGYSYYSSPIEERFYHEFHKWFKPSGFFGHGLGIVGTLMILFGVLIYIARKRYNFLARYIRVKYLLEFHIFLCTLGPILILFHTAFKFGGIVSIAFWSMVAVVLSGVVGRFIYIQIPRTIEGRALSLTEVQHLKANLVDTLQNTYKIDVSLLKSTKLKQGFIGQYTHERKVLRELKSSLKNEQVGNVKRKEILQMVKNELRLTGRISRLQQMQRLFKYWHVAHLPFAIIMLIIVVVHIVITLLFGYKWIF